MTFLVHSVLPCLASQNTLSKSNNIMVPHVVVVLLLSLLATTTLLPGVVEGIPFFKKKHRRQKAGTRYEQHDPVHVVVNKVG